MNIVYVDAHAVDPTQQLDWSGLKALGNVSFFSNLDSIQNEECYHAEIVITNKIKLGQKEIHQLPNLRLIQVSATGYNIIDLAAASQKNISVANVPAYSTASTAQHTWALMMELSNQVGALNSTVRADWPESPDFCTGHEKTTELEGKTLGIIGLGAIGLQVRKMAIAFGMRVIYHSKSLKEVEGAVSLDELLEQSDVISLHCPQTTDTERLINKSTLNKCKPNAWLINCSRGGLINETDLAEALHQKTIAAAALDSLSVEPPPKDHVLLSAPNCIITGHVGWGSRAARQRLLDQMVENIKAFQKGEKRNIVN